MQLRDHMFSKAELCFLKSRELYKSHLGAHHRTVGDCTFAIAMLHKQHLKLARSLILLRDTLAIYQEGIGVRSLKSAHCYEEMGKICIL
jgi:hypothetical protein